MSVSKTGYVIKLKDSEESNLLIANTISELNRKTVEIYGANNYRVVATFDLEL